MQKTIKIFFALLFPVICSGQSALLHQYLSAQQERIGFNGVVLVTKNGRTLYQEITGKASQELNVPMSPHAVFRIASISKQFTAMLVTLAAQEGRLRLDDSLAVFFPALKDTLWRRISLKQLLSHTSGVPHNEGITDYWILKSRLPLSKEQALTEIFGMRLLFTPGTGMKYSSPAYFLLACILEAAYKRPYAAILEEKILQPLQMKHTGVLTTGRIVPGMASAYHLLNDSLIAAPHRDLSLMKGSGDLYSTAEDLAKWNYSFSGNSTWNDNLQELLFTAHTQQTPAYGYGWFIRQGKRRAYFHGGGTFGCSAISAWYPDEKISVVILSNVSVLPVNEMWSDIEKIIFNEPFELKTDRAIQLSAGELQAFAGRYAQQSQELNIQLLEGRLYAKLGNNPAFEIFPEEKGRFFGKKVNVHFTFQQDGEGNVMGVEAEARGERRYFKRE
ncbi:serine hydrolase [Chitinophaga sp. YIM B06452]|uniref:serine hydrolase n=1 Tax=Chitinophaga sp. YIM B06452 TaxID=3082158 RepID=UPI0031FF3112